jgi:2-polyprenyl-3-methyl-5-hydroxy-6-metoxy-1,4-benzoquinol methylase
MFLEPMPSYEVMQAYANEQYKKGGAYNDYVKAKPMKIASFDFRLKQITPFLPKAAPIHHLDVGCSAGYMLEVGLKNHFDSYGVEFSQEAISLAQTDIQKRIYNMDVEQLHAKDSRRYELITCYDIIEHLKQPEQMIQTLGKLLTQNGLVVIATPDTGHYLAKLFGRYWPMRQPYQHTILFSKTGLKKMFEKNGFQVVCMGPAYKVLTFDYLTKQLRILNPVLSAIMGGLCALLPNKVIHYPLKINISEFILMAKKV